MRVLTGNIFTTECQTIVNTVNCVGVMGAGIALECRLRYPEMYERYVELCERRLIDIGKLWLYKAPDRWVLNFPTKRHWKKESKPEYLRRGLTRFLETYRDRGIESIAFPLLGASHGGLSPEQSLDIMSGHLERCEVPVEVWQYDPEATDDLYLQFRASLHEHDEAEVVAATGLRRDYVRKVLDALDRPDVNSLSRLASVRGIGFKTLERSFQFVMSQTPGAEVQGSLF